MRDSSPTEGKLILGTRDWEFKITNPFPEVNFKKGGLCKVIQRWERDKLNKMVI